MGINLRDKFRICKNKYGYYKVQCRESVREDILKDYVENDKWIDVPVFRGSNNWVSIYFNENHLAWSFKTKDRNEIEKHLDDIMDTFVYLRKKEIDEIEINNNDWECEY